MSEEKRYLALLDEEGEGLARPDLYVLIRMSISKDQGEADFEMAYKLIALTPDNTIEGLNGPEALLEKSYISGHKSERRYAALVLSELHRLYLNGEKPTLGNALRLVTHNLKIERPQTQESSIKTQVRKAFAKWRNTCHLELACLVETQQTGSFEANPEIFQNFLEKAKALEMFMDRVCEQGELTWNPWRVPEQIEPNYREDPARFSLEENALIAAN